MQLDLRKKDLIAHAVISIIGTILAMFGLSERISSEPARPPQALVGPVGAVPTIAPYTFVCASFQGLSYRTLGDVIAQLGPPEKVFLWHQGGPENLFVNYGYKYLYPQKGVNFVAYGPSRNYGNAEVINPKFVQPTVMPMDNLQANVAAECYSPTTLETYMAQYPGNGEGHYGGGDQYVDWTSP